MSIDPTQLLREDAAVQEEVTRQTRFLRQENERLTAEAEELARLVNFYDSVRQAPIRVPAWR